MAKVDLYPDFRAFLKSLNSAGVEYLLIGGYAVAHYGYERVTKDIDVWVAVDPANAQKLSAALQSFGGFSPTSVPAELFLSRGKVFMFGREPVRIDILTDPSGVVFRECFQRRLVVEMDGLKVPVIALADLRANKLASGRSKDLTDLEHLPQRVEGHPHPQGATANPPRARRRK